MISRVVELGRPTWAPGIEAVLSRVRRLVEGDVPIVSKATCILLLNDDEYLANAAEDYCSTLYRILCASRSKRSVRQLPAEVFEAAATGKVDYVFNFLSAVKVPEDILDSTNKLALNFHPAPPEYPGVGCASYALFDRAETYGVVAHRMEKTYDSGEILKVLRFPITPGDYCDTLFDRALNYTLLLFYEVCYELAQHGKLDPCGEEWARQPGTRKEFEEWMVIRFSDSEELAERKIRATQHNRFAGPYVEFMGRRFAMPPREK